MTRHLMIALAAVLSLSLGAARADQPESTKLEVWKSPACGCCSKWASHMEANAYHVTTNDVSQSALDRIKREAGIGDDLAACHTARIGGYVVEGHVPAEAVTRLLKEKPDAVGITVPGMPVGSPGMEFGDEKEVYEVLLVKKDGTTEVFSRHGE